MHFTCHAEDLQAMDLHPLSTISHRTYTTPRTTTPVAQPHMPHNHPCRATTPVLPTIMLEAFTYYDMQRMIASQVPAGTYTFEVHG